MVERKSKCEDTIIRSDFFNATFAKYPFARIIGDKFEDFTYKMTINCQHMNEHEKGEMAVKVRDQFGKSTSHDAFNLSIKIADSKVK